MAFVLSLFVPDLSFFWCLGKAVLRDCGISWVYSLIPLLKHAYSNILKILPPKNENFQIKKSDIFHNSAQNIDCGYSLDPPRRGGSNEYPQHVFVQK